MAHNYYTVSFSATAQQALDKAHRFQAPVGMTLVGVSVGVGALGGSPTNVKVDVMGGSAGTTELIADAVTITALGSDEWLTSHFGGANAPIAVAKGDLLSIDIKFTGGSTPSVTGTVVLTFLAGTA